MIGHYNAGTFDRFLAEDTNIVAAIRDGEFGSDDVPVQLEVLNAGPLYHFLGTEFAPFMERLSRYIITHAPFDHEGML